MLAISCKKNEATDPGTFSVSQASGNVTNLVRSQISSNDNNKAGTSNVQDLVVKFSTNGSYTTVVTATYLETNNVSGSYNPSTGVITLTDITNWTNNQGAPLFDTNPSNFTVKITATGPANFTSNVKEFTIPATLQFANIISNATGDRSISNALYNPNVKSSFGEHGFYSNQSSDKNQTDLLLKFDSSSGFSNYIYIKNSINNYAGSVVLNGDTLRELIFTNGSYTNYFSDLSVTFASNEKIDNIYSAFYNIVFTGPYYSNEMEQRADLLILGNFTNKID